jgi:SsrA-binding protein
MGVRFPPSRPRRMIPAMASKEQGKFAPRIGNRRALHEYFITAKIECGIALQGSEVKSLRQGKASLQEAYARIETDGLTLHNAHIDPYEKATIAWNHDPKRPRRLLVHKRELRKLEQETREKGTTLIPLAVYFKGGRAKVEIGVARGKQKYDKRETIKRKEQDRELRRVMSRRG